MGSNGGDLVHVAEEHCALPPIRAQGHTRAHLCLYAEATAPTAPVRSRRHCSRRHTLFNRRRRQLHPRRRSAAAVWRGYADCLSRLPAPTRASPDTNYIVRAPRLQRSDREPSNSQARALAAARRRASPPATCPSLTLAEEKQVNVVLSGSTRPRSSPACARCARSCPPSRRRARPFLALARAAQSLVEVRAPLCDLSPILNPFERGTGARRSPRRWETALLVLAGAGSGKTRVLTHRIAWLITTEGVSPHGVLARDLVPTQAAAEMRARVETRSASRAVRAVARHCYATGIAYRLLAQ